MPKRKTIDPAQLCDGWHAIADELTTKFRTDDPEGWKRLSELGKARFNLSGKTFVRELVLVALDPRTANTVSRGPFVTAALATHFDAAINLLTFARREFWKMTQCYSGRARLKMTGTELKFRLPEYEPKEVTWPKIAELLEEQPKGVLNARDQIRRASRRIPTHSRNH